MPHPNKAKGDRWERLCAELLGLKRSRLRPGVHDDEGDLDDWAFIYECKDDNSRSPIQWWEQAERARARTRKPWSVVLAKTACMTGKPKKPDQPEGWAIMSIEQWKQIRGYLGELED